MWKMIRTTIAVLVFSVTCGLFWSPWFQAIAAEEADSEDTGYMSTVHAVEAAVSPRLILPKTNDSQRTRPESRHTSSEPSTLIRVPVRSFGSVRALLSLLRINRR
jgi:hypothetical protein